MKNIPKKYIYIAIAVIVIVLIIGAILLFSLNNGKKENKEIEPTVSIYNAYVSINTLVKLTFTVSISLKLSNTNCFKLLVSYIIILQKDISFIKIFMYKIYLNPVNIVYTFNISRNS